MKRLAFLLVLLLVLTALPLGVSADGPRPTITSSTASTVPVGTLVVLTVEDTLPQAGEITPAADGMYQWYIGDPMSFSSTGPITPASFQLIPGATQQTYEPDTSVPGVTSYFCVLRDYYPSEAYILTVVDKSREFGYVPDDDAPGFEAPAETPAPVEDANPDTGAFVQGMPHFGFERAQ